MAEAHPTIWPERPFISKFKCLGRLGGWLLLTAVLVFLFEPHLTPPGFTRRGSWAMPVVLLGAFHSAKWCRSGVLFLVYGCAGALTLLPMYLIDTRTGLRLDLSRDVRIAVAGWVAFVVAMGFLARLAATARWRWIRSRAYLDVPNT